MPPGRISEWVKIGELARRTGTTPDLLRAWERRYHLLQPRRTASGHRLYSRQDEQRVRVMQRYLASGRPAGQAAELACGVRLAVPEGRRDAVPPLEVRRAHAELRATLEEFAESPAQRVLEVLLSAHTRVAVLRDVVLPFLREVGDRWADGHVTVAQEHFASGFFEARLGALARGWDRGTGPRALLACPAGERHTLGLMAFGIALHDQGWRIVSLGADTPLGVLADAADRVAPELVVLAGHGDRFVAGDGLRTLAAAWPCAVGGPGVDARLAAALGVRRLAGDPITAALSVGGEVAAT